MNMDIFSQVYADALLDDTEQASIYYPRTDSLLIALFNKVKVPGATRPSADKFKSIDTMELPL